MRLAFVYDMDACRSPTGVTRHALAQLERLATAPEVQLTLVSGRISEPDGLAYWEKWESPVRRRELPLSTRSMLRLWRVAKGPPLELWTGSQDWLYSPVEYLLPSWRARKAVTSHDVLQDLRYGTARRRALVRSVFQSADRILSVSRFNTDRLLEAYPECQGRVALVPNAAEDLFHQAATFAEIGRARARAGLPEGCPYLLSVANFQPRKNLALFLRALRAVPEVVEGELAVLLVGEGSESETRGVEEASARLGPRARVLRPGYRQGEELRALYAGASALVFPSLCESFGIPAVEAMAQRCPVALADSTALPEVAEEAGWYFPPDDEEALAATVRSLLADHAERARKVELGVARSAGYRWDASHERLIEALRSAGS
jgi:alpha-1,3-rhamnosyl/mannosyltransferase